MDFSEEVGQAILEMRDLMRLLAEDKVAERDQKQRDEIRKAAGASEKRQKAILLMNGTKTQAEIQKESLFHQGDLSALVKQFTQLGLLNGDPKKPCLAITLPESFFETKTK